MNTVVTPLNASTLRELVAPPVPLVSAYLGLWPPLPTADPSGDLELRWRALAGRLAEHGADSASVEAAGRYVFDAQVSPCELALFARDGSVRLAYQTPGGVGFDRARFGVADVVPLLAWLQRHPPYAVVTCDRTGAEVTAVRRGALIGSTITVVGPDDEIERNAPGGWSQPRYQRRAEDSWAHNAAAVAKVLTQTLRRVDAGLLLVAGDVRAVQLLEAHLPVGVRHDTTVRHVPGGRSPDGSEELRQAAVADAVAEHAEGYSRRLFARFEAEYGPKGSTVDGTLATIEALRDGRIRTLFVADEPDDDRVGWYGPGVLCVDQPDDAGRLSPGRLVDVAVRAALLTDAEVHVLPAVLAEGLSDRIGGLCRY
jgi:hypothetical protein